MSALSRACTQESKYEPVLRSFEFTVTCCLQVVEALVRLLERVRSSKDVYGDDLFERKSPQQLQVQHPVSGPLSAFEGTGAAAHICMVRDGNV